MIWLSKLGVLIVFCCICSILFFYFKCELLWFIVIWGFMYVVRVIFIVFVFLFFGVEWWGIKGGGRGGGGRRYIL